VFFKFFKSNYKVLFFLAALCFLTIPIVYYVQMKFFLLPKVEANHKIIASFYPKILSDLKLINEKPPFEKISYEKNAESYITQHVSWSGNKFTNFDSPSHKAIDELFKKYSKWKVDPKQFEALYKDPLLLQIDTNWMEQLHQYTYWDFSSHPKVMEELKRAPESNGVARIGIFASLPIPSFSEFRRWATVYTLQKSHKGKALEGLKRHRFMSQMLHSSGILIGNMIAVDMLKEEHALVKNLKINNWNLVSNETIDAYKRVSWGWVSVVQNSWFEELPKEFEPYMKPETGVCAAAWENSAGLTALSDFLEKKVFLEKDFSKNFQQLKNLKIKLFSKCNMKNYEVFSSRMPASPEPLIGRGYNNYLLLNSEEFNNSVTLNWVRIPYIRQIVGLNLATEGAPNYMRLYDTK
jgi:hypothetical protein